MNVIETALPGVLIVEPKVFGDQRGFFLETYQVERYRKMGIEVDFVQDNTSLSRQGILRGLHLQNPLSQAKLVQVVVGEVFDVAVDVRWGSPTFGKWTGEIISAENKRQLFIPAGFAHGFYVTSETALFCYKCSSNYVQKNELTLLWNDPDIGITWPLQGDPLLADKDRNGRRLRDIRPTELVKY